MKLFIAVPTLDYIHADFAKCLLALVERLHKDGIQHEVRILSGTLVYNARNKLANAAINEGFSHVLWLDSDMIFTESILDDLTFCGREFVTGIYHARRFPHVSCIFSNLNPVQRMGDDGRYPNVPFEIAGCGFGGVLMSVDCLKKVKQRFGTCFLPMAEYGEDLAFCKRWADCGGKMYAEPTVQLGHIGHITIYPADVHKLTEDVIK